MSAKQQRSKAVDVPVDELVELAQDPQAFDRMIAEFVRVRESAHDRERQAVAAEAQLEGSRRALQDARAALDRDTDRAKKELDDREADLDQREAELQPRELRIEEFQRKIRAA